MALTRWEYAEIYVMGGQASVSFSHRQQRSGKFWEVVKQLGDEGWEMVGLAFYVSEYRYTFKRPLA